MFVLNFKLNAKKIFSTFIFIAIVCVVCIEIFYNTKDEVTDTNVEVSYDYILDENNFISVIKNIHENLDANIGKTVSITGFVFRLPSFENNTFVCGRNILINDELNVAGIMCRIDNANEFLDNEWVTITGTISKLEDTEMTPIIQISTIEKVTAPANTYVEDN